MHYPLLNSPNNNLEVNFSSELPSVILTSILSRDYALNTKKAIWQDLRKFFDWYAEVNEERFCFERVTKRDIIDFRAFLQKKGKAVATINRVLTHIRIFCEEGVKRRVAIKNPTEGVKQLTQQSLSPKGLSVSETRRFLREVEILGNLRDRAIIELMLGAGLRASEVVKLTVSDIFISERHGYLDIKNAKGNKTRKVPLHSELRKLLTAYMTASSFSEKLFSGQRGHLKELALNKIVAKYGKRAGLKLSPHTLRHTFAYNYLRANPSDIVGLAQILGHSNINTTAIYTQNRIEDLQEKAEKMI